MRSLLIAALLLVPTTAFAQTEDVSGRSGLPLPRFVSLRASEANMRAGPGDQYPIAWVYQRSGLPLEVVREWGIWRQVRDPDGTIGWMNKNLLSGERTAYVTRRTRVLYAEADLNARPVWRIEPGVVARILFCGGQWCRISVEGRSGYVLRNQIWGTYSGEAVE